MHRHAVRLHRFSRETGGLSVARLPRRQGDTDGATSTSGGFPSNCNNLRAAPHLLKSWPPCVLFVSSSQCSFSSLWQPARRSPRFWDWGPVSRPWIRASRRAGRGSDKLRVLVRYKAGASARARLRMAGKVDRIRGDHRGTRLLAVEMRRSRLAELCVPNGDILGCSEDAQGQRRFDRRSLSRLSCRPPPVEPPVDRNRRRTRVPAVRRAVASRDAWRSAVGLGVQRRRRDHRLGHRAGCRPSVQPLRVLRLHRGRRRSDAFRRIRPRHARRGPDCR